MSGTDTGIRLRGGVNIVKKYLNKSYSFPIEISFHWKKVCKEGGLISTNFRKPN